MRGFGVDQLNYQGLIQCLSKEPNYPFSLHLRNHFIAPYAAQPTPVDSSRQDAWTTYGMYRKGAQVLAVGDVPSCILTNSKQSNSNKGEGLWAIAVLFPSYSSNSADEKGTVFDDGSSAGYIWNKMRLILYISSESESEGPAALENVKIANAEEEKLLSHILHIFVPRTVQRLASEAKMDMTERQEYSVDLFAVNEAWVKVLKRWTDEGDTKLKVTRTNPCMTFIKAEVDAQPLSNISARWLVSIVDNKDEEILVQSSNSLSYPLWYIAQRKHISLLIYDNLDSNQKMREAKYPKEVKSGSPAAWAYAHDDISLASLHVAEPYRRLKLGSLCVELMAERLVNAQKQALSLAGCSSFNLHTPYLLDTEMHKGASRLFFEAQGFTGVVIATWGSFSVRI